MPALLRWCSLIKAKTPFQQLLRLVPLVWVSALLSGCLAPGSEISWAVFPLQRSQPHDGLAVVNQPDGYGLHIFLETDTRDPSVCSPRWLPDPARLFNGNGTAPFSSGLASRQEFFAAIKRPDVRAALRRELQALCKGRAPTATWRWQEPPRSLQEVVPVQLPAFEEEDLLTNPVEELERQQVLLNGKEPS